MGDQPPQPAEVPATPPGDTREPLAEPSTEPTSPRPWGQILRRLLVWAGIVTLAAIALLASAHLVADVGAVLGIRGGFSAVVGRLMPTVVLALVGLGLALLVAWLAAADRRRELAAIAVGFGTLILVRVFIAYEFDGATAGEPATYDGVAETFLSSEPDLRGRPPGYPVLLAGIYSVISDRHLATELLNLVLAVLAGGAVLGLTRGHYGPRAGALALLGYAIWPAAALMTVVRIPQVAFDLAIVAAAWAAVGMPPGWKGSAVTGVLLGLAQYLRPTAPILLPAFIVARWWPGDRWPRNAASAIVAVIAFLLVLTPIMAYNYERTGSPSFSTSDYGGQTLYIGLYEPSGGTFDHEANRELIDVVGPDPLALSALGTELALERIKSDPLGVAALAIRKQDTLWGTERYGVQYAIKQSLKDKPQHPKVSTPMLLSQGFYVLVLLSALGAMIVRRHERDALVALVTLVIWAATATHALLEVRDRYHAYAVVLMLPLAAWFMAWLVERIGRRPDHIAER